MNSLFRLSSSALRPIHSLTKHPLSICKLSSRFTAVKLDLRYTVCCYSSGKKKTRVMGEKYNNNKKDGIKNDFFVVRKGHLVGVYNTFTDCQSQLGSSISDLPASVYKGESMPKNTQEYLASCGLKNAFYSIRAADLKDDIFGPLIPCPYQGTTLSTFISTDYSRMPVKNLCILEFDGASKGNPGHAGAGAVLRSHDGAMICKLRQGLGTATTYVAEYRAMILGLRYALDRGFKSIRVLGDSKPVCMQESNPEADAQANLGVTLADGEIQEELT